MSTPVFAALAAILFSCNCAQAQVREPDLLTNREGWFKAQIECAIKLAHTEGGNQDDDGQRLVVWIAAQRALDNRKDYGGSTICQVAYMQTKAKGGKVVSQFSGMHQPFELAADHPARVRARRNSLDVLLRDWKPPEHLRPARFYVNPKYADPEYLAWMQKRLRKVGVWQDHHFFCEKQKCA